jgi:hypothetical protein
VELDVLSLINHTHSAATEFLNDAVVRDGLADERLRFWHLARILGCGAEASQRISAWLPGRWACALHQTYSGIERSVRNVSLVNIEKVAKGLKMSHPEESAPLGEFVALQKDNGQQPNKHQ